MSMYEESAKNHDRYYERLTAATAARISDSYEMLAAVSAARVSDSYLTATAAGISSSYDRLAERALEYSAKSVGGITSQDMATESVMATLEDGVEITFTSELEIHEPLAHPIELLDEHQIVNRHIITVSPLATDGKAERTLNFSLRLLSSFAHENEEDDLLLHVQEEFEAILSVSGYVDARRWIVHQIRESLYFWLCRLAVAKFFRRSAR